MHVSVKLLAHRHSRSAANKTVKSDKGTDGRAGSASEDDDHASHKGGTYDQYAGRPIYKWLGIGMFALTIVALVAIGIALVVYRK